MLHAQAHLAACAELRASQLFQLVLVHVLAAVKVLNAKHLTLRSMCGFRLTSLAKLVDTKSTDGTSSLLQVGV